MLPSPIFRLVSDAIELAIASGTTRVSIDGVGSTEYRTLADLYRVRDDLRRDLGISRHRAVRSHPSEVDCDAAEFFSIGR